MKIQNTFFQKFKEKLVEVHSELNKQFRIYFENKLAEKVLSKKHSDFAAVK